MADLRQDFLDKGIWSNESQACFTSLDVAGEVTEAINGRRRPTTPLINSGHSAVKFTVD